MCWREVQLKLKSLIESSSSCWRGTVLGNRWGGIDDCTLFSIIPCCRRRISNGRPVNGDIGNKVNGDLKLRAWDLKLLNRVWLYCSKLILKKMWFKNYIFVQLSWWWLTITQATLVVWSSNLVFRFDIAYMLRNRIIIR